MRGNIPTRLNKLDNGEYGALVLAAAGLKRLGLEERISRYFSVEEMIPAAGQGILGIQGRADRSYGFLQGFFDPEAMDCARCERAYMTEMNGGCSLPMGVYAEILDENRMKVMGLYYDEASKTSYRMCMTGERSASEALGIELARKIKEQ